MIYIKIDQRKNSSKKDIDYCLYFILVFIFIFIISLSPQNAKAAPPEVIIDDSAPLYVNESSATVCVLDLTLTDDNSAMLMNITVTIENMSALVFDPNTDLAPLSADNSSGIMIYNESNFIPGFQTDDNPIWIAPAGWGGVGPWTTTFYGIGHYLPNSTIGSNYYIVIRTSAIISNDEVFRLGIEANGIQTDQGGVPLSTIWSKNITADILAPFPNIFAFSETLMVKVGDWINITATISGDDATSVTINLSEFNGLSDSEPMVYNSASGIWYYNITSLLEGDVDTGIMPYIFNVSATDKSGKNATSFNFTVPIDTNSPTVAVIVEQENFPASIDNWINITVITDSDVFGVNVDLASAGFSGQNDNQTLIPIGPGTWFYNFTIMLGTSDGSNIINIDVMDDAGNTAFNNTETAFWDDSPPQVTVTVFQESIPAGIGEWINITVTTDADVIFVDGDLAAFSGQGASQSFGGSSASWFYNFTVFYGTLDGLGAINVSVLDDVGYLIFNDTQKAEVDEIPPTLSVTANQSSSPAGIGDWINITVTTVTDVVNVVGDLSDFFGQGASQAFNGSNGTWYYNFTVLPGLLDGFGIINITVTDDAGNTEFNDSESAFVDEIAPIIDVVIIQSATPAGIGEWINITVTTDVDSTAVQVDLATAGFTGQMDNQGLSWSGTYWFYEFFVVEGTFDGSNIIEVSVMDDAGNIAINNTEIAEWDEVIPTVSVTTSFKSIPAATGDWINISVTTDTDVVDVIGDLSAFYGQGGAQSFFGSGGVWSYNFTVQPGSLDGFGMINITVIDDAGNTEYNDSAFVDVDEITPTLNVVVNQDAIPAGIGDWINITVTTDSDVVNVIGDLSAFAGQGPSQTFFGSGTNWYYNFTIQVGSLDGQGRINVTVIDDAGNSKFEDTKTADVDEIIPTVFNIESSHGTIAEANFGQTFYLNITYSEDMDLGMDLTIMFLNPSLVGTLTFSQGSWDGTTIYRAQYIISDDNVELQNVDIEVSGAFDLAGNIQVHSTSIDMINVDTVEPIVTNIEYSHTLFNEASSGKSFYLNITFSEEMDTAFTPAISYVNPTLVGTLIFSQGAWDGTTVYRSVFVISDNDIEEQAIDIEIRGILDLFGNIQVTSTTSDVLNVDTKTPTITNIEFNHSLISEKNVDETFYLNITFSEGMDSVTTPNISFVNPNLLGTLAFSNGAWDSSMIYRSQYTISDSDSEQQNVDIEVSGVNDLAGNILSMTATMDAFDIDTIKPTISIIVREGSSPAAISDWINITVITDADVSTVDVDLAQAGLSGQIDDQVLIRIDIITWYYNFTVSAGITDASFGVSLNVDVIDYAGNINSNSESAYFDEVYPQPISLEIKAESQPAKVNDWINITVDVGGHLDIASILVDAPGVFTAVPIIQHFGNLWYLNISIVQGTVDEQVNFTVTLLDDAGNMVIAQDVSIIDNEPPTLAVIESISDQTAISPETVLRGSLTINAQTDSSDILKVSFFDEDPAGEGTWLGDDFDSPYSFDWITNASDSGVHNVYIRVYDDAGNFKDSSGTEITISNILKEPDSGIPLEYVLIIGCIAAISAGSIFIAATEIGRIPLFFFFYLLYTRLKKEYVLDNFTRGRIYGYVEANPGEHFNAIKRALDLKNGSLAYHLRTLEREEFITSKRDRGYTRYYPRNMKLPKRNVKELIPIQRNIVVTVKSNPGISQRGIADKLNISFQLVHYHIKVLQEADYLYLEKDEKQTYCYDSETHKLDSEAEKHFMSEPKQEDGTAES
jgi:DNA-binding MarR family transcriptional regulator